MSEDSKYENEDPGTTKAIVAHPDGTHPIHRCPVEVLQCIFEEVLPPILSCFPSDPRETHWWQAALLCSVCRHWRHVALATPTLWTSIMIHHNKSPEKIESHWIQALQRVKLAPANVWFDRIGQQGDLDQLVKITDQGLRERVVERFLRCSLRTIPWIHTLQLEAVVYRYPFDVLSLIEEFPTSQMECLEIIGNKPSRGIDPRPAETWNTLLHRFPPFRSLKLSYVGPVFFSPSAPLLALVDLCLTDASEMKIIPILAACPNLERLSICTWYRTAARETSGLDPPCPPLQSLRFLDVGPVRDFPWDRLGPFPNLSELKFRRNEETETPQVVMNFIQRHLSITNISIEVQDPLLPQLSNAAPQLTSIAFISRQLNLKGFLDWKEAGMDGPAFPKLQMAEFHPIGSRSLDLQTFEAFVRKRCLPASHLESELDVGVHPLRQMCVHRTGEWSKSKYIDSATVRQHHQPDPNYVEKVTFSWL